MTDPPPPRPTPAADDAMARQRALIDAARAQVLHIPVRHLSLVPSSADAHPASQPTDAIAGEHDLPAPDAIPGYQILREIHRGAQGVVYQALQKATQRHVAIKVMREGPFAGPTDRARFEREVQILAQLDHPNIVTIHDSGSAAGCHYFVMDLVRGQPLDAFIGTTQPDLRATLTLFAEICDAVNDAHLRGVIHRDLKPGNIRVDPDGRPHILDFGLAKTTWDLADSGPSFTVTGQFVGSLPWASPEQAEGGGGGGGGAERIDIRTDVYSLGVVLFQMLTGRFPYPVVGPVREVLDRIVNAQPMAPSQVSAERARAVAIDNEVDTLVLKCLAKEPARRYQSAGELARDVRHYLAGEAIDAKRDSTGYVLRKQLRRHRVAFAVAAGFVLLLAAGLIVSFTLWRASEHHRTEAETNLELARQAEDEASASANRAQRITTLLIDSFRAADPKFGGDSHLTAREAIDRGAAKTLAHMDKDPLVQAGLLKYLGIIYGNLGAYDRSRELLSRALEIMRDKLPPDSREIAETATSLGDAARESGDNAAAEEAYRTAFGIIERSVTAKDWHLVEILVRMLRARGDLTSAEPVLRATVTQFRATPDDPLHLVIALNSLGEILEEQRRYPEAVEIMREALSHCPRLPPYYSELPYAIGNNLAWLLMHTGELDEAREMAQRSLDERKSKLPAEHLDIASSMFVLASIHMKAGNITAAAPLARESLRIRAAALPADDYRVRDAQDLVDSCDGAGR
jgi:serine/threonine protein kinase